MIDWHPLCVLSTYTIEKWHVYRLKKSCKNDCIYQVEKVIIFAFEINSSQKLYLQSVILATHITMDTIIP